ncbi:phosphate acyltransferase PlsX [Mycoplasmopsis cricetuli]|uniref:phosphate acyltransferase PlsX n=1 Tax=Mycoplasmopsis cricetuli TaxID=171283 RepID=UPI000471DBF0|nr:phosphate acyltransferase PlsX [Mycoplasmopsis cricetuli]
MFKYTIAFDINGNDNGPEAAIEASKEFALSNPDIKIILIGDIKNAKNDDFPINIEVKKNDKIPTDPKNFKQTLRENTSMNEAIELVKNNEANCILSSGDSGSYIASLTLKIKRISSISRPAFMPVANAINGKKFVFLDVGANLEAKPEWLYQWGKMASDFYSVMFNDDKPRITMLNIGTENYKGLEATKQAHNLFLNDPKINYLGFSETRDLFRGNFEVGVIDGYGGNLVLKSYEGAVFTFIDALKASIHKSFKYKIGALLMKNAFKDVMKTLDYRNVGSAWVIGVKCLALKCHGSSDKKSYLSALKQLKEALEKNVIAKIMENKQHEF